MANRVGPDAGAPVKCDNAQTFRSRRAQSESTCLEEAVSLKKSCVDGGRLIGADPTSFFQGESAILGADTARVTVAEEYVRTPPPPAPAVEGQPIDAV